MARIHADPVSTSLMHPTRRALYVALSIEFHFLAMGLKVITRMPLHLSICLIQEYKLPLELCCENYHKFQEQNWISIPRFLSHLK